MWIGDAYLRLFVLYMFYYRPRNKQLDLEDDISPELPIDDVEDGMFLPPRDGLIDDRTSTPCDISVDSVSAVSSSDPFTQQKIIALEDELASLRAQIAQLVQDQENNKIRPSNIKFFFFFFFFFAFCF